MGLNSKSMNQLPLHLVQSVIDYANSSGENEILRLIIKFMLSKYANGFIQSEKKLDKQLNIISNKIHKYGLCHKIKINYSTTTLCTNQDPFRICCKKCYGTCKKCSKFKSLIYEDQCYNCCEYNFNILVRLTNSILSVLDREPYVPILEEITKTIADEQLGRHNNLLLSFCGFDISPEINKIMSDLLLANVQCYYCESEDDDKIYYIDLDQLSVSYIIKNQLTNLSLFRKKFIHESCLILMVDKMKEKIKIIRKILNDTNFLETDQTKVKDSVSDTNIEQLLNELETDQEKVKDSVLDTNIEQLSNEFEIDQEKIKSYRSWFS